MRRESGQTTFSTFGVTACALVGVTVGVTVGETAGGSAAADPGVTAGAPFGVIFVYSYT